MQVCIRIVYVYVYVCIYVCICIIILFTGQYAAIVDVNEYNLGGSGNSSVYQVLLLLLLSYYYFYYSTILLLYYYYYYYYHTILLLQVCLFNGWFYADTEYYAGSATLTGLVHDCSLPPPTAPPTDSTTQPTHSPTSEPTVTPDPVHIDSSIGEDTTVGFDVVLLPGEGDDVDAASEGVLNVVSVDVYFTAPTDTSSEAMVSDMVVLVYEISDSSTTDSTDSSTGICVQIGGASTYTLGDTYTSTCTAIQTYNWPTNFHTDVSGQYTADVDVSSSNLHGNGMWRVSTILLLYYSYTTILLYYYYYHTTTIILLLCCLITTILLFDLDINYKWCRYNNNYYY